MRKPWLAAPVAAMLNIAATLSLLIQIAALKPSRLSRYKRAEPRVEGAGAMAVAVVEPLWRAFMPAGADHAFHIGLHQQLQHRLGERTQEVAVVGLLQQLDQCHPLLGHRVLRRLRVKRINST
jgi:hypothetical protein